MAYAHIYVIPDTGEAEGGDFYDRFGNLEYFADVAGLTDKTSTGYDVTSTVKSHSREHFMRDPAPSTVASHSRFASVGIRQIKGAVPGVTVTLTDGVEKRDFQYTGTMSGLVAWLKTTALVIVTIIGPSGTPYDPVPVAAGGALSMPA